MLDFCFYLQFLLLLSKNLLLEVIKLELLLLLCGINLFLNHFCLLLEFLNNILQVLISLPILGPLHSTLQLADLLFNLLNLLSLLAQHLLILM